MSLPIVPLDDAFVADPYAVYERLRANGPVHRVAMPNGSEAWLVLGEAEIRAALGDTRLSIDRRFSGGGYSGFSLPGALDRNLLNIDPPDHTRLRRLVSHTFTSRRVENLAEPIRRETDELSRAMAERDTADLIDDFAVPLALTVIGDLLGIPADGRRNFRTWTNILLDPDPSAPERTRDAVLSMYRYLVDLIALKRGATGDDLLSALVAARDGNEAELSEDELVSLAFLLFWAGYENSVNFVGTAVLALLTDERQKKALESTPDMIGAAVEELLRFAHPNQFAIRRFPTVDMSIGGVAVAAGETVLLGLAAADRDPERFTGADVLDLSRNEGAHLAFGYGIHYCVGAPLARLEARIAIGGLMERFPRLALLAPPHELRWRSFRERGLRELPVRLAG